MAKQPKSRPIRHNNTSQKRKEEISGCAYYPKGKLGEEPPFLPSRLHGYNPLIWGSSPHIHSLRPGPMSSLGEIPDMPRKRSWQSISLLSTHCEQEATSRNQRNISTGEKGRLPSSQNELPQEVVSFLCLEGLTGGKALRQALPKL